MYVVIRRVTSQPGAFDEVLQRDKAGLVPLLRSIPGFVEFDLIQVEENVGVSLLLFETQEQAEEGSKQAGSSMGQREHRPIGCRASRAPGGRGDAAP